MTELLVVLSLTVTLAIVLVLVGYLVAIIYTLWTAGSTLEELAGVLINVRDNTKPLPEDIPAINGALKELLGGLLRVNGNLAAIVKVAQGKS